LSGGKKTLTVSVEEAEELIEMVKTRNLVLQVGDVERFNSSVIAAIPFINSPIKAATI
jgi:predicted dehydrogenase